MKLCKKCNSTKSLVEFSKSKATVDGYSLVNYANYWFNKIKWNKELA